MPRLSACCSRKATHGKCFSNLVRKKLMKELFRKFLQLTSQAVGSSWSYILAVLIIVVWAISGPMFHFSDTWQLLINTGTTIITFLMVFLIQATQTRDSRELHLKLDELLRAISKARPCMAD